VIRRGEIPAQWEAARRVLAERLDDVVRVLDKAFKAREQFRDVKEVEVDTGVMPVDVAVAGNAPPLAVLVLRATPSARGSASVISNPAVTWEWRDGAVRISAIGTLAASTRYLVTLALVE
jgi:hypothetical protein